MTDMTVTPPTYRGSEYNPTRVVSYSSMTLHRKCPQAWSYRYLANLESLADRFAADLGTWWHLIRAMDSIDRGKSKDSLIGTPSSLSMGNGTSLRRDSDKPRTTCYQLPSGQILPARRDTAHAIISAWWKTLSGQEQDDWAEAVGEPVPDRLRYMDDRYQERWESDLQREAPLYVEARVTRDLPGTSAEFTGFVDEIYFDERRKMVVVRDHKTSKLLPGADSEADLSDSQLHLYAWAASELVGKHLEGKRVQAIAYDRVRTVKPKEPSLTLTGNLSKGTSDYDLHTYLRFAAGPDGEGVPWGEPDTFVKTGPRAGAPKWGMYTAEDTLVQKLSTPAAQSVWHQRTLTPINNRIVESHLRSMAYSQTQAERSMAEFKEHGEAPRNFSRWACRSCDFKRLCAAQLTGGPDGTYPLAEYGLTERNHQ